jgi:hypothetical protein
VAEFCKHRNEHSGSIDGGELFSLGERLPMILSG